MRRMRRKAGKERERRLKGNKITTVCGLEQICVGMHDRPSHPFSGLTEITCHLKEEKSERVRESE